MDAQAPAWLVTKDSMWKISQFFLLNEIDKATCLKFNTHTSKILKFPVFLDGNLSKLPNEFIQWWGLQSPNPSNVGSTTQCKPYIYLDTFMHLILLICLYSTFPISHHYTLYKTSFWLKRTPKSPIHASRMHAWTFFVIFVCMPCPFRKPCCLICKDRTRNENLFN